MRWECSTKIYLSLFIPLSFNATSSPLKVLHHDIGITPFAVLLNMPLDNYSSADQGTVFMGRTTVFAKLLHNIFLLQRPLQPDLPDLVL